ncbi:hypothetical protein FMM05_08640 [Flavobacterium zepuense]|uniref:Uncharacterized protein n=1 Tax=Flavobacterium zepuense TaxID=2593302 RepID=A0A552V4J5_9FLAO|nr:hypothetical protein [Flavobacterium zepuense]TRW25361.1 hypothetical protein FMM05_08640 [Flavobacterium zepuense]
MEKQCKWHFKEEGGRDVGPNDPVDEKFKGMPYYSIVREAIQNSLDAVRDKSEPVKVDFKFSKLNRSDMPNFFELEKHIIQSQEYYNDNPNAKRLFAGMLKYLNDDNPGERRLEIPCLKISDYNTYGMTYVEGITTSPFYAFLRAGGVSSKNQSSGGSFGFGKGAYYTLSPIKTILVSTVDENDKAFFQGSTILTTHKDVNGNKLTAYGYYDNNNGEPVNNAEDIPEIFQRTEKGTDVLIIGLWPEFEIINLMVKSVLNNFWLSIHDDKLIVQIDNIIIKKENLERIIDDYFKNEFEHGSANEIETWNPKSYYKAIKYALNSDQFQLFEEELDTIGKVRLYVYLEKGLPNRVSYFRTPRMVVFKRTNRKVNGYAAVFICDSKIGNDILRLMENPAHNEWKKENYPKEEGSVSKISKKAEAAIAEFINAKLDSLSKIKTGKKITFIGLEEYLSIPEDLLEKEENSEFEGMSADSSSGKRSNDITDEETGMITSEIDKSPVIKPKIKSHPEITKEFDMDVDIDGENKVMTGGGENGDGNSNQSDTHEKKGSPNSQGEQSKTLIKIDFKVVAQFENEKLYHNLIINTPTNVSFAELELLVGADNDRSDGIQLTYTTVGETLNNIIKKVPLIAGKNLIKVCFADNIKHSIKLKAYEIH